MAELLMPEPKIQSKSEESLIAPLEKIKFELREILKKMKIAQQSSPVVETVKA